MAQHENVIFLSGYRRDVEIGVLAEEYGTKQGLLFDIEVTIAEGPGGDEIDQVISYDSLVEAVEAVAEGPRLQLLETFAERLAERCLADPRAKAVRITIAKLDRLREGGRLGVLIVRTR